MSHDNLLRLDGLRVFLTGATGFIGSHLSRALIVQGAEVHAIRRTETASTRLPCAGIHWHTADMLDVISLGRAIERAEPVVVIHLAAYGAITPQRSQESAYRVNVEGAWNLWNALATVPCRIVVAGTCGEYGSADGLSTESTACEPSWFYPATKNAAGTLLKTLGRETGREVVVLRLYGPFGEADDTSRVVPAMIDRLLRGESLEVTRGEQRRDFSHVDDHVQAFLLAGVRPLPSPVATYNIGSGKCLTLLDFFEIVSEEVGGDARSRLKVGAIPYRQNETMWMCADISRARADLGYEPQVPLREGIARTVAWYRAMLAGTAG